MSKTQQTYKTQKYIMESKVGKYELALVLQPLLKEDIHSKVLPRIYSLIDKYSGTHKINPQDDWGKRHLEYAIAGYEEGYFVFLQVELPADAIKKISFDLNLEKRNFLLRYLLIGEDKL